MQSSIKRGGLPVSSSLTYKWRRLVGILLFLDAIRCLMFIYAGKLYFTSLWRGQMKGCFSNQWWAVCFLAEHCHFTFNLFSIHEWIAVCYAFIMQMQNKCMEANFIMLFTAMSCTAWTVLIVERTPSLGLFRTRLHSVALPLSYCLKPIVGESEEFVPVRIKCC